MSACAFRKELKIKIFYILIERQAVSLRQQHNGVLRTVEAALKDIGPPWRLWTISTLLAYTSPPVTMYLYLKQSRFMFG